MFSKGISVFSQEKHVFGSSRTFANVDGVPFIQESWNPWSIWYQFLIYFMIKPITDTRSIIDSRPFQLLAYTTFVFKLYLSYDKIF